jgi:hypothetical protein
VGTVVQFQTRPEEAAAKTEAILSKIGELHQQKVKAKEELPGVLSSLIAEGESAFALRALTEWGTGEREPYRILIEAKQRLIQAKEMSVKC